MKKIITHVLIFITVIIVLDQLVGLSMNYFYTHTFVGQDGGDINKYLHDNNPPPLVIMGSSTARFQVNPDSFSLPACNLGHSMTTDRFQLGLLLLMIKNNKVPKNILLSLWPRDYLVFGRQDQKIEDILYLKYYYNQCSFIQREINAVSFYEPVKYLFSSYRFNGNITNILKYYYLNRHQDNSKYYFKYQASNLNDSINITRAQNMRPENKDNKSLPLSTYQTGYLAAFIDTCAKYHINLMCYYMPMRNEDTVLIKNGVDFINKTITEKNIPVLKFNTPEAATIFSHPTFWVDGEHMNEKGGGIESAMLAAFVKEHIK